MAKLGREARKRRGRAPKVKAVDAVSAVLGDGKTFILCNNKGLTLSQATALRKTLREKGVGLKVVKNTLLKLALTQKGVDVTQFKKLLKEQTMVAVGTDPVTPAKLLLDFAKTNDKLQVKGGFLDGKVLSAADVEGLSKLPSKEQLIARLMGSMMAPAQNLVYALNQTVGKVVYATDAYRRKLEGAA